jgi:hypothetical protein
MNTRQLFVDIFDFSPARMEWLAFACLAVSAVVFQGPGRCMLCLVASGFPCPCSFPCGGVKLFPSPDCEVHVPGIFPIAGASWGASGLCDEKRPGGNADPYCCPIQP